MCLSVCGVWVGLLKALRTSDIIHESAKCLVSNGGKGEYNLHLPIRLQEEHSCCFHVGPAFRTNV